MGTHDVHLQYDPSLPHQVAAIDAVVDLFEGVLGAAAPVTLGAVAERQLDLAVGATQLDLVELGFANPAPRDETAFDGALLSQLQRVQRRSGLEVSDQLDGRHFTVEMETGTGKTYVYLRTIFELHAEYGLTKFIVAVPSVAIREGVLASLRSMAPHFRQRYATPIDHGVYDSKRLSVVRQFATSSTMQVLVMNIQSFQKDSVEGDADDVRANVINRAHDGMSGRRPIEFIQAVRPVVVIDEPQNFESEGARAAIDRLKPLCTLRYSATPRRPYNLIHRLGPVDAFQQGLVKQIEVDGIEVDLAFNDAHVRLLKVDPGKNRAQIEMNVGAGAAARRTAVWVRRLDDLRVKAKGRAEYSEGFMVEDISYAPGAESIEFTGGAVVPLGATPGAAVGEVQRLQVRQTIRYHLDRERALTPRGIKVLSLFFLDAVADYRVYAADGSDRLGPIGEVFEDELARALAKPAYAGLDLGPLSALHDAYFSRDGKGRPRDSRGTGEADGTTYELIMAQKERLLSPEEPLRFIFTHSALREGWDNPNVFQVCTLTHAGTAITRRQQIGRGLRLPVDVSGARVHDREVARLTVIANESYEAFARGLQVDYERETGQTWGVVPRAAFARVALATVGRDGDEAETMIGGERSASIWEHLREEGYIDPAGAVTALFAPTSEGFELPMPEGLEAYRDGVTTVLEPYARAPVRNARERVTLSFRKRVTLDPGFQALWADISGRTRYRVRVDSEAVVRDAVAGIAGMEGVPRPLVRSERAELHVSGAGVTTGGTVGGAALQVAAPTQLPDILAQLQNATDLTRETLRRILLECGRLESDFAINPHAFMVEVTRVVRTVLGHQLLGGVEYERIDGMTWEMHRLEPDAAHELTGYLDRLYKLQSSDKSPYSHVEWDSAVEERFARRLDEDERVRFFIKLPPWFTVDTPVGRYNPDWAICWDDGENARLHMVRETKSTLDEDARRASENDRIVCARRHFDALGVSYAVATDFEQLVSQTALDVGGSRTSRPSPKLR